MPELVKLLLVSAVVMGLSHTVATQKIFEPLRNRLGGKDTWIGYLVSCPYCASHWIAFAVVPLTGTYLVRVPWEWGYADEVATWFLSSILVTVLAAFLRIVFWLIDEKQALTRKEKEIAEDAVTEEDDDPALRRH